MTTVVVYVHGLWLRGHEAALLRRRLATALEARVLSFSYPSVRRSLAENAEALRRFLTPIRADRLHLVAHSMGGLVILRMFEDAVGAAGAVGVGRAAVDGLPPGRIVFMGSPVRGSQSAARLVRLPLGVGHRLLGLTGGEVLVSPRERRWSGARDLGVIAGDLALGAGRLLGPLPGPNDGTVLVRETDLPGATEQLRLRVSHSGMPFSATVARQVAAFLRDGRFGNQTR
jgi:pimeloyl-ACP methyl ester carboxylesterase